jgi:F0F1-type ATP synthase assembly protein I
VTPVRYDRNTWNALGAVSGIGFIMAGGALVGWWGGTWLDRRWGTEPWGLLVCLLLGLAAAAWECGVILRRTLGGENRKDFRGPK